MEGQFVKGGTVGAGVNALLTIVTVEAESDNTNEETFRVPFYVIDTERLANLLTSNMIRGYRLEKIDEGKKSPFHAEIE